MNIAFVPCLPPGIHPGMDALAHGLAHGLRLTANTLQLFPTHTDNQNPDTALKRAAATKPHAIVLFVTHPTAAQHTVADILNQNIPVITIHQPAYPVSASLIVPNFNHGIALVNHLAQLAPPNARLAILGPPDFLDDLDMIHGATTAAKRAGLQLVNNPLDPKCRNLHDTAGHAHAAATFILDHHPFDALLVFNDESMRDTLQLLEQRKLIGRFPLASRNGTPQIVNAVRRGKLSATFDYCLPEIGLATARLTLAHLAKHQNNTQPPRTYASPFGQLITQQNAHTYAPWAQRVPHRELKSA